MSAVSQSVSQMFGGISQQAPAQRFPHQHEDQKNTVNTVKRGPTKRFPSEHVSKVASIQANGALVHTINRDVSERYKVVVLDGDIRVFDLDTGAEKTVGFPNGSTYLNSTSPEDDFSLVTVADYTFVVNKKQKVGKTTSTVSGTLTGTKQRFDEVIRIDSPSNGDIYEVAGDYSSSFDNYYVLRTGGAWRETAKPGEDDELDPATMPHTLVRNSDGTFTFDQASWDKRLVGDLQSVPFPSFVDETIEHVFFFRHRLCFLTTTNVVMSRTGKFFNFFKATATDLLDTDPIDVGASHTSVVHFRSAVPHNKTLMLNADQTQFVLNGGEILSPKTVSIDPTTSFVIRPKVEPVGAGPNVYFVAESGSYSSLMEYFVEPDTVSNNANDVTSHVSSLLPKGVKQLASSSNFSSIFVVNLDKPKTVYAYHWHWRGNKKVMSAWNYWEMPGEVLSAATVDQYLVMVIRYSDGLYLERVNLDVEQKDSDLPYFVRLDRRVTLTGSYDSNNDETTWTLTDADASMEIDTSVDLEVVQDGTNGTDSGVLISGTSRPSKTEVKVSGDYGGVQCIVGVPYSEVTELSRLFFRKNDDSVLTGNLVLRSMQVAYAETGFFKVEVSRKGSSATTMPISPADVDPSTGRVLGSIDWTLGTPTITDGEVRIPIMSNADHATIKLINDSPVPSSWQQFEWAGEFTANYKV